MLRSPVHKVISSSAAFAAACCLFAPAAADDNFELATAFGTLPEMWGLALSPDGAKISMLHMLSREDMAAAFVMDPDGNFSPFLVSKKDKFEISWCKWANQERLLCGASGIGRTRLRRYMETRLIAVDSNGKNRKVMLQDALQRKARSSLGGSAIPQFQDRIIDWLPDDTEHVLLQMPDIDGGTGVIQLDVYAGTSTKKKRSRKNTYGWISDGRGNIRLRQFADTGKIRWDYRKKNDGQWHLLHETAMDDLDDRFIPAGFGDNPDELLVFMPLDGRRALWSRDLSDDGDEYRVVYADKKVDLHFLLRLGKHRRLVAVTYSTDRYHYHFFDSRAEQIIAAVRPVFQGKGISIVDESWDREVYLLHVTSDIDPGRYYRFEPAKNSLAALTPIYPTLSGRELAPMKPIVYAARDGVDIPGYLTLPVEPAPAESLPTVVLPHGGPQSRDVLGYNWLVQFLAAKGYAVLQVNFRGSGGFGASWAGEGGFKAWRQTIADITDGARYLLDEGISAPGRACIVGWSYGGYAALMSVIEEPELYNCVVSIAGVTDPKTTIDDSRFYLSKKATSEFISRRKEVLEQGSPLWRADDISVPVLMLHGDEDLNVTIKHSEKLNKKLKKAGRDTELVIYDDAEHSIWSTKYRIDLLDQIGRFLDRNTGTDRL